MSKRIVVTGMSVNTALGDTLDGFRDGLMAGRSAVSKWKAFSADRVYSKVGGDLSAYDVDTKLASLQARVPPEVHKRLRKLVSRVPWTTKLSMLLAVDGWLDAGLFDADYDPNKQAVVVSGHNLNALYQYHSRIQFEEEPDFIDGMTSLYSLDTDHAGCVSEVLQARGPIYTMGAACASGNVSLRSAIDGRPGGRRRARVRANRCARDGHHGCDYVSELQR
jgi:3-oxoacyl-(acyl-carrier-protein) synthase